MKISEIHLYKYSLQLKQPLVFGEKQHNQRRGYVIELLDENGNNSFGEVAPLDGYSDESYDDVTHELLHLKRSLIGCEIPENLEKLSGDFGHWLSDYKLSASVRFGFESAVLLLIAKNRKLSLAQLLSDNPLNSLRVNALLSGSYETISARVQSRLESGYSTFKLKVGSGSIEDDIKLTKEVHRLIGTESTLRLDANCQWTTEEFEKFAQGVSDCDIEIIEEPVSTIAALREIIKSDRTHLPIALDESLRRIAPESLHDWSGVKAIVLKPTMLGLEKSCRLARVASELNMDALFSSSYESSLGLMTIAQIAAAFNTAKTPIGLDTMSIFKDDLMSHSITITDGQIDVSEFADITKTICRNKLKEVSDA